MNTALYLSNLPASVRGLDYSLLACDPGEKGGMAFFAPGQMPQVFGIPEVKTELVATMDMLRPGVVAIEKVHAGPKMGSSAAFTFGYGYAALQMAAFVSARPANILTVSPASWQVHHRLIKPSSHKATYADKKRATAARAKELFPNTAVTQKTADALLIGLWAIESYIPRNRAKMELP